MYNLLVTNLYFWTEETQWVLEDGNLFFGKYPFSNSTQPCIREIGSVPCLERLMKARAFCLLARSQRGREYFDHTPMTKFFTLLLWQKWVIISWGELTHNLFKVLLLKYLNEIFYICTFQCVFLPYNMGNLRTFEKHHPEFLDTSTKVPIASWTQATIPQPNESLRSKDCQGSGCIQCSIPDSDRVWQRNLGVFKPTMPNRQSSKQPHANFRICQSSPRAEATLSERADHLSAFKRGHTVEKCNLLFSSSVTVIQDLVPPNNWT